MARRTSPELRAVLKAQREFREKEARDHHEELAIWIGERGPVGEKLAERVGMVTGRRF